MVRDRSATVDSDDSQFEGLFESVSQAVYGLEKLRGPITGPSSLEDVQQQAALDLLESDGTETTRKIASRAADRLVPREDVFDSSEQLDEVDTDEDEQLAREWALDLDTGMESLDAPERRVIRGIRMGRSPEEIAEEESVSRATIYNRRARAIEKLAEKLAVYRYDH